MYRVPKATKIPRSSQTRQNGLSLGPGCARKDRGTLANMEQARQILSQLRVDLLQQRDYEFCITLQRQVNLLDLVSAEDLARVKELRLKEVENGM